VSRRVGGWNSANVFHGAPIAAPLAITMAGLLGIAASRLASSNVSNDDRLPPRAGAVALGSLSAFGLAGTTMEAGALHFRGAFQNPFMYAPVAIPPIAAVTLATATLTRSSRAHRTARGLLRLTGWLVSMFAWVRTSVIPGKRRRTTTKGSTVSSGGLPRAIEGQAPDVFRRGGWVPMRSYGDDDEVDFAIVGTGAGGGTLTCKPASAGFRVVAFDAGPFWRPLEDFASDEKSSKNCTGKTSALPVARIRFSSAPATAARVWVAAPCISP
jgi:hypothetical protein